MSYKHSSGAQQLTVWRMAQEILFPNSFPDLLMSNRWSLLFLFLVFTPFIFTQSIPPRNICTVKLHHGETAYTSGMWDHLFSSSVFLRLADKSSLLLTFDFWESFYKCHTFSFLLNHHLHSLEKFSVLLLFFPYFSFIIKSWTKILKIHHVLYHKFGTNKYNQSGPKVQSNRTSSAHVISLTPCFFPPAIILQCWKKFSDTMFRPSFLSLWDHDSLLGKLSHPSFS